MLHLHKPTFETEGDFTYFKSAYSGVAEGELWFRTNKKTADHFDSFVSDAFILPALLMAMEKGVDLSVDNNLSDLLFFNINTHIQTILTTQSSALSKVRVLPKGTIANKKNPKGVATGLSCGVDSFGAVYTHLTANPPESTKLTHLTQYNHAQQRNNGGKWLRNIGHFERAAEQLEKPLVVIGTNFSSKVKAPHTMCHTYLNCSAAIAMDGMFSKYYYASTFNYADINVTQTSDIAHAEPIVLPLISTENIRFFSTGSEIPRTKKTEHITSMPLTREFLEVCPKHPADRLNCSSCYKCLRTMLTLDILGQLDSYTGVFDVASFRAKRQNYSRAVLKQEDNPYMTEIKSMPGALGKLRDWAASA